MTLKVLYFILLGIESIEDIREKKIRILWIVVGLVMGLINIFLNIGNNSFDYVIMLLPGLLLFIAAMTGKGFGKGDAIMILVSGLILKNRITVCCFWTFIICAILALTIKLVKKADRDYGIPFIPCLLSGFLIEELLLWVG